LFENKVFRKVFKSKKDEVDNLVHKKELCGFIYVTLLEWLVWGDQLWKLWNFGRETHWKMVTWKTEKDMGG